MNAERLVRDQHALAPRLIPLDVDTCLSLLAGAFLSRLAFVQAGRPRILPMNYLLCCSCCRTCSRSPVSVPRGHPRRGTDGRDARAVDLRGPQRRHSGPTDRLAMLASSSVQEAHDLAAVAHAATLRTRVPFLHFFDGFRTSHEVNGIDLLDDTDLRSLVDDADVLAHRARGLDPDRPVLRGSAQNPDVFFQAREAANPFYEAVPGAVQAVMDHLAARSGRAYHLVDMATYQHVLPGMQAEAAATFAALLQPSLLPAGTR